MREKAEWRIVSGKRERERENEKEKEKWAKERERLAILCGL